jgi:alpha-1,6-mannosyltransferase
MATAIKDPERSAEDNASLQGSGSGSGAGPVPGRYGQLVLAGLVGTILIGVGASLAGSPFAFKVPGAWFFGVPSAKLGEAVARASGGMLFAELALGFAGIVLLCRAWLAITKSVAQRPGEQPGRLAGILALWSVPLLVAPPLFSDDIYSYAAQGEMVSRHISPYLYGPGVLGASPFSSLAQGVWINTPSPYGPLFNGLDGRIVELTDHRVLLSLVLLRLLAVVGVVLMAVFVPRLAGSYGKDPAKAFSLGVLNPLVLLFLVGSGHNDSLMIGLLVAGLYVARRGHPAWGMAICALAGAIKIPGLAGAFAIAWTCPGTSYSLRRRVRLLAQAVVISAATFEALSALFGVGWGWVGTIGASDSVTSWITPVDLVAKLVPKISGGLVPAAGFLTVAHVVGLLVAAVVCVWAVRHLPTLGLPRVMGISLLALVLLGPIVQPWYLLWGIAVLAVTAGTRASAAIALLSVTVSLVGAVGLGQLDSEFFSLPLLYQLLSFLVLAAVVVVPICRVARGDGAATMMPVTWRRRFPVWQLQRG